MLTPKQETFYHHQPSVKTGVNSIILKYNKYKQSSIQRRALVLSNNQIICQQNCPTVLGTLRWSYFITFCWQLFVFDLLEGDRAKALDKLAGVNVARELAGHDRPLLIRKTMYLKTMRMVKLTGFNETQQETSSHTNHFNDGKDVDNDDDLYISEGV